MSTEFDMFENTGHDDTTISLATTEQLLGTLESVDFMIPESFDATILQKEELPASTKLNLGLSQEVSEDCSTKILPEESMGAVDIFHYRDTPKNVITKKVYAHRKDFRLVNKKYKATLITKSLVTHVDDIPGYAKYKQEMQEALEDINVLRKKGNMTEWSLETLLNTRIQHENDFLSYTFNISESDVEWDNHEIEGAQVQFIYTDPSHENITFTYIPKYKNNPFHKAIKHILKQVSGRSFHTFAALAYKLPERLVFSTKSLPINLKTPSRKITYEMYGSCLVINIPWIQGLKFSSVNYDRRYFKIV